METPTESIPSAEYTNTIKEEILDEIADLEEYARLGKQPPRCRGYRVKINGEPHVLNDPSPTAREVLTMAGFLPPENYTIRVKIHGQRPRKLDLDEEIDLTTPGVEKFKVLPKDQTEG